MIDTKSDGQNSFKIVILNGAKRNEGSLMIRREHSEILRRAQNDKNSEHSRGMATGLDKLLRILFDSQFFGSSCGMGILPVFVLDLDA